MCHVSCVICHMSPVMCHLSHVTCDLSHGIFFLYIKTKIYIYIYIYIFYPSEKIGQSGGASWWRVSYQRGLPRLVFFLKSMLWWLEKVSFQTAWVFPGYWTYLIVRHWAHFRPFYKVPEENLMPLSQIRFKSWVKNVDSEQNGFCQNKS